MSFQSPMKEKASNLKSDMADDKAFGSVLDGEGIGSLSLTKPDSISQLSSAEEVSNDVDEELQAEELGSDVDEELPGDPGDGPCWICNGPHERALCAFQYHCPLDLKVGEDYKVIRLCGWDVVNEKCVRGCTRPYGQVMEKVPYILERMRENGQITST